MTAKRIGTVCLAVLALVAGSNRQPILARSAPSEAAEMQPGVPVAELAASVRPATLSNTQTGRMQVLQNALYFAADDGTNGVELWRLDATGAATMLEIVPGPGSSSPNQLTVAGDRLYFTASTAGAGVELWMYDGTNPPVLVADVFPGPISGDLRTLTAYGNMVVFGGNNGVAGDELYSYDPVNGLRLFDICPATNCETDPYGFTVYNGLLYFAAADPVFGFEIFSFNGSTFARLTDLPGGPTGITGVRVGSEDRLIFGALDFGQYRVYSYNISTGVTSPQLSPSVLNASQFNSGTQPVAFNGAVYFAASDGVSLTDEELWVSDGSAAGTHRVQDFNVGTASSLPRWLTVFDGKLYFSANDGSTGGELRSSDGSTILPVIDINPGPADSQIAEPALLGNYLFFEANGGAGALRPWFTTGTAAETDIVKTASGELLSIDNPRFTAFNGALYFRANDGSGRKLWRITLSAAPSTTTTLESSLNPSIYGDQVTFTATVTGVAPTGSVTFFDDATPLGTVPLTGGTAGLSLSSLTAGTHTITAKYSGDGGNAPSTSTDLIQVVNKAQTTTALISSLNPSLYTESVTFTATVSGGTSGGNVTLFDGVTALSTVGLVGNVATFQVATLTGGSHSITATYEGNTSHASSTSNAVSQTVTRLPTTTTLFSTPDSSTVGDIVTFTAAVTGAGPTGDVVFSEGAVTLATVQIVATAQGNLARFQTSTLTVGVHTITATYLGDTNHSGSAAGDNQTVDDVFPPTPPVANTQTIPGFEDVPIVITLTGSDVNNDPLTFSVESQPTHGTVTGNPPNVTYTPELNYSGLDSFTFKAFDGRFFSNVEVIRINLAPVNDAPVAGNDFYTTAEDTPLIVTVPGVMANDSDVDTTTLTASVVTTTVHGVLSLAANGSFSYTPLANFFGADSFTYRVSDGELTSTLATVSITVTPMNDAPIANNDSYTATEGQTLTIAAPGVLANDTDVEGTALTATQATGPSNGSMTLNANGSFTYTPASNFTGTDSFTYRANDGAAASNASTVTISVAPRNLTWTATGILGTRHRYHTATRLQNGKVLVTGGYGQGNGAIANTDLYDPLTGTWTPTNNMRAKRAAHTATLLQNGLVLVAGGGGKQAETYDPTTGTWTAAGTLNAFHDAHTATLLPDGKVLIVGGVSVSVAELFDPATRTWTVTGSLSVARHFHTATLLPDGKVLVVGGYGSTGGTNSVELYDPASGVWSSVASLTTNRTGHTASLLASGKVLVVGGGNNSNPVLATTELYDPTTDTWTVGASLSTARVSHTATVLSSGRVLVAGGGDAGGASLTSSELFDPITSQWSPTASLISGRVFHTATLLADGRVLAAGGSGALNSAELYGPAADPAVGRWDPAASLTLRRIGHTASLLPDGRVLVSGGQQEGTVTGTAEIFDPTAGVWTPTGSLNQPRAFHVAVLLDNGKVLVAAGSVTAGYALSSEIYDPATGAWSITGGISVGRVNATATLLPANRGVLLAGGITGNGFSNTAEIYNLATGSWASAGSFTGPRYSHRATALSDGRVLLTGGVSTGGNPFLNSAVIYDPANFTWADASNMNSRRVAHTATLLPNGRVLVAGGNTKAGPIADAEVFDPASGIWTPIAAMKSARVLHSATLLQNGNILVAGGQALPSGGALLTSEIYDPTVGTWTATGNLAAPRTAHTATRLANGKVFAVGGWTNNNVTLATVEVYTP